MKIGSCVLIASCIFSGVTSFSPSTGFRPSLMSVRRSSGVGLQMEDDAVEESSEHIRSRREVLSEAAFMMVGMTAAFGKPAFADEADAVGAAPVVKKPKMVMVAGATGQTGRRILERLADGSSEWDAVVAGVRNVDKATKSLGESSTVIRGAMVQNVPGIADSKKVSLKQLDVVSNSVSQMVETSLDGVEALVIAVGFVPGNPLKMNAAAHAVDNVGTCALIDAAKQAGVKKVVLVSSILTNGRAWGQENSPGFVVTNAFGKVLDEKLVAENYLKASGMDWTIVRPGGLKAQPPAGELFISGEDTLNSGEVSRDLVADVCVASLTDPKASNKVLEIIEKDDTEPKVFNGLVM